MHALVTGGAGFIGSAVAERLLADGHQVTVIDNLSRGLPANLPAGHAGLDVVAVDIRDPSLKSVLAGIRPEVIFHLAAQIDVRHSVSDPKHDAEINVMGTLNVAEAARRSGVRKIVFASSGGSIYGNPARLPVDESAPLNPLSPYAVSKLSGELYLNSISQLHGLECTHLAMANVYGPRQDPHGESGVVAIFAEAMLAGRPTRLFGGGTNTRDYVYVTDAADAFIAAAGHVGDRQRFNIGCGIQTTDRELHTAVAAAVGIPDSPEFEPARLGDIRASALDSGAARHQLGWTPKVGLTTGITRTVDYFRQHPVAAAAGAPHRSS